MPCLAWAVSCEQQRCVLISLHWLQSSVSLVAQSPSPLFECRRFFFALSRLAHRLRSTLHSTLIAACSRIAPHPSERRRQSFPSDTSRPFDESGLLDGSTRPPTVCVPVLWCCRQRSQQSGSVLSGRLKSAASCRCRQSSKAQQLKLRITRHHRCPSCVSLVDAIWC